MEVVHVRALGVEERRSMSSIPNFVMLNQELKCSGKIFSGHQLVRRERIRLPLQALDCWSRRRIDPVAEISLAQSDFSRTITGWFIEVPVLLIAGSKVAGRAGQKCELPIDERRSSFHTNFAWQ